MKVQRKHGTRRSQSAFKRFVTAPRRDGPLTKYFVISSRVRSEAPHYRGGGGIGAGGFNRLLRREKNWTGIRFRSRCATGIENDCRGTGTLADRKARHATLRHEPLSICHSLLRHAG